MGYGRQVLGTVGSGVELSVDGKPLAKTGGITLDWSAFAAVSGSDVTLPDGVVVKVGEKYAKTGQVVCKITSSGKYGPFDPAATSTGRESLVQGSCFMLNRPAFANEPADEHPEAVYGGKLWLDRVVQVGTGTASLAAGPTLSALRTAFPQAQFETL